jgi:hypothetical protein
LERATTNVIAWSSLGVRRSLEIACLFRKKDVVVYG